jgi:hypothetical protein
MKNKITQHHAITADEHLRAANLYQALASGQPLGFNERNILKIYEKRKKKLKK